MRIILAAALVSVLALTLSCGSSTSGPAPDDGWSEVTVDGILLAWLPTDSTLSVQVTAPTTGWVAVGFDPDSIGMIHANILLGYWNEAGSVSRDDWGNATSSHRADTLLGGTDDIAAFAATEASGATTVEFTIPLVSGDAYDKPLSIDSTYAVILAYGPDGADDFSVQHELFTSTSITLTLP